MLLSLGSVSVAYTSGNITNIGIEPLDVKDYFMFFSINIRATVT